MHSKPKLPKKRQHRKSKQKSWQKKRQHSPLIKKPRKTKSKKKQMKPPKHSVKLKSRTDLTVKPWKKKRLNWERKKRLSLNGNMHMLGRKLIGSILI